MNRQNEFHLAVIAEHLLNKKMLVKANNLEEAKLKATEHLENHLNSFSMIEIHQSVKNRDVEMMKIN